MRIATIEDVLGAPAPSAATSREIVMAHRRRHKFCFKQDERFPMALFLAIDAGGTKTDYVIANETTELARTRSGTIKRMRAGEETTSAHLTGALRELTEVSGLSLQQVDRTCIGTAGNTVPLVTDWLREALGRQVSGELLLTGDVDIALDAAFRGGPGVLVLAGTGSNVAGRSPDGVVMGVGGWGPALADQGSGHRIGHEALRAAFLARDEGKATVLMQTILEFWQLKEVDELVGYANRIPSPDYSQLTHLVVAAARAGDEVARGVLRREGQDLGHLVCLMLRRVGEASPGESEPPAIAFAGSIMQNVEPVREALVDAVRHEFPSIRALPGVVDPLDGALWRARRGM